MAFTREMFIESLHAERARRGLPSLRRPSPVTRKSPLLLEYKPDVSPPISEGRQAAMSRLEDRRFREWARPQGRTLYAHSAGLSTQPKLTNTTVGRTAFDKVGDAFKRDPVVGFSRKLPGRLRRNISPKAARKIVRRAERADPGLMNRFMKVMRKPRRLPKAVSRTGKLGALAVGVTALMGIGFMRGAMSSAREQVYDRYMQDQRYSRNMLYNSRVGYASGTNRMLNRGGTQGLTLAMSRSRHGAM